MVDNSFLARAALEIYQFRSEFAGWHGPGPASISETLGHPGSSSGESPESPVDVSAVFGAGWRESPDFSWTVGDVQVTGRRHQRFPELGQSGPQTSCSLPAYIRRIAL